MSVVLCFQRTVLLASADELSPVLVEPEELRVADDDEEGLASGDGHVEPEKQFHLQVGRLILN